MMHTLYFQLGNHYFKVGQKCHVETRTVYCQHEFDTVQYFYFQYPIHVYRIYSKHTFYAVVMLRYREEGGFSGPNFFSNNNTIDQFHSQHLQCMCLANELKF